MSFKYKIHPPKGIDVAPRNGAGGENQDPIAAVRYVFNKYWHKEDAFIELEGTGQSLIFRVDSNFDDDFTFVQVTFNPGKIELR